MARMASRISARSGVLASGSNCFTAGFSQVGAE
jgi:hypothetical protein